MTSLPDTGPSREADAVPPRSVAVLLEAPRPELLPAGLVEAVGDRHAVRLFRVVARRTLDNILALGWQPEVWYHPADAHSEMTRWLGGAVAIHPRDAGSIGETLMRLALASPVGAGWLAVRPCGAGIPVEALARAGQVVESGGIVFGGTTREDVYLIGGPATLAPLVRTLPWGEGDLAPTLRARLRDEGSGWAELPRIIDVTTAAEARAVGLIA